MFKFLRSRLFPLSPAQAEKDEEQKRLEAYSKKMQSLDMFKCKAISCTLSSWPRVDHYFDPPENVNVEDALYTHLLRLWEKRWPEAEGNQFNGLAVIAAGLLSFGELDRVDYILNNVPPHRIILDHGCGYCNIFAVQTVSHFLPLPESLSDYSFWIEGSVEIEQVKQWLDANRSYLSWDSESKKFVFVQSVEC